MNQQSTVIKNEGLSQEFSKMGKSVQVELGRNKDRGSLTGENDPGSDTVVPIDFQQDSIILSSKLHPGAAEQQLIEDSLNHGNVTIPTHETSLNTNKLPEVVTKRENVPMITEQSLTMTKETDSKGPSTLRKNPKPKAQRSPRMALNESKIMMNDHFLSQCEFDQQLSIFSENRDKVIQGVKIKQKSKQISKEDRRSRNYMPHEFHTSSDAVHNQIYGNYSLKNQKFFSKSNNYNNKGKSQHSSIAKERAQEPKTLNLAIISTADARKECSSLPKISKTDQIASTQVSVMVKEEYQDKAARSLSQLIKQSNMNRSIPSNQQIQMLNSQYQNLPMKNAKDQKFQTSSKMKPTINFIKQNKQKANGQVLRDNFNTEVNNQSMTQQYFGQHNSKMGAYIGSGKQNLRDTLVSGTAMSSIDDSQQQSPQMKRPVLNITEKDLQSIISGKLGSKQFVEDNKKEIKRFLSDAISSEEKMMGYLTITEDNFNKGRMAEMENANPDANTQNISLNDQFTPQSNTIFLQTGGDTNSLYPRKESEVEAGSTEEEKEVPVLGSEEEEKPQETRRKKRKEPMEQSKISSKVMEVWLNEALQDAQHMDVPGVILKPEHRNPVNRYGIDRLELTNQGLSNEFVDRIYRSLFVYSIGFFNMIKNIVKHKPKSYSIIARIWKVFSILLEYCQQTDYQMIISKIVDENREEIKRIDENYEQKMFEFQRNQEMLKQNMVNLQRSNEELERDKDNERTLRLKLEEEYVQNSKNHEEEVELRLKFESKLNNMHANKRETDIKYKRAITEMEDAKDQIKAFELQLNDKQQKIIEYQHLIQKQAEQISILDENRLIWEHEVRSKSNQMNQMESRLKVNQSETNQSRQEINEIKNEISKKTLELDISKTKLEQTIHFNTSLKIQLKESKEICTTLEKQAREAKEQYDGNLIELNEIKKRLQLKEEYIQTTESQLDGKNEVISHLTEKVEELSLAKKNLQLEIETLQEQQNRMKEDFKETAEKLHFMNKVRHDLLAKLEEEGLLISKLETKLEDKETMIVDLQKKINDLQNWQEVNIKQINDLNEDIKEYDETVKSMSCKHQEVIEELEMKLKIQESNSAEFEEKVKSLQATLIKRDKFEKQLHDKMDAQELENTKLEYQLKLLQAEHKRLQAEYKDVQEGLTVRVKDLEKREVMLKNQYWECYTNLAVATDQSLLKDLKIKEANENREMAVEDLMLQLQRQAEKQKARLEAIRLDQLRLKNYQKGNDERHKEQDERHLMALEDLHRKAFNLEHQLEIFNFKNMELQSELDQANEQVVKQQKKNQELLRRISELSRRNNMPDKSDNSNSYKKKYKREPLYHNKSSEQGPDVVSSLVRDKVNKTQQDFKSNEENSSIQSGAKITQTNRKLGESLDSKAQTEAKAFEEVAVQTDQLVTAVVIADGIQQPSLAQAVEKMKMHDVFTQMTPRALEDRDTAMTQRQEFGESSLYSQSKSKEQKPAAPSGQESVKLVTDLRMKKESATAMVQQTPILNDVNHVSNISSSGTQPTLLMGKVNAPSQEQIHTVNIVTSQNSTELNQQPKETSFVEEPNAYQPLSSQKRGDLTLQQKMTDFLENSNVNPYANTSSRASQISGFKDESNHASNFSINEFNSQKRYNDQTNRSIPQKVESERKMTLHRDPGTTHLINTKEIEVSMVPKQVKMPQITTITQSSESMAENRQEMKDLHNINVGSTPLLNSNRVDAHGSNTVIDSADPTIRYSNLNNNQRSVLAESSQEENGSKLLEPLFQERIQNQIIAQGSDSVFQPNESQMSLARANQTSTLSKQQQLEALKTEMMINFPDPLADLPSRAKKADEEKKTQQTKAKQSQIKALLRGARSRHV